MSSSFFEKIDKDDMAFYFAGTLGVLCIVFVIVCAVISAAYSNEQLTRCLRDQEHRTAPEAAMLCRVRR